MGYKVQLYLCDILALVVFKKKVELKGTILHVPHSDT